MINLVELMAASEDCAFDQPCKFGHRVEFHAVYCHNEEWKDAPRKCKYGDGCAEVYGIPPEDNKHELCPGFSPNQAFSIAKGE